MANQEEEEDCCLADALLSDVVTQARKRRQDIRSASTDQDEDCLDDPLLHEIEHKGKIARDMQQSLDPDTACSWLDGWVAACNYLLLHRFPDGSVEDNGMFCQVHKVHHRT